MILLLFLISFVKIDLVLDPFCYIVKREMKTIKLGDVKKDRNLIFITHFGSLAVSQF